MAWKEPRAQLCKHGVLINMRCSQCDSETARRQEQVESLKQPTTTACFCRIFIKWGLGFVDVPQGEDFNFGLWCALVKGEGAVKAVNIHIPYENIAYVAVLTPEQAAQALSHAGPQQGERAN
jgi:hypothetical protein